jgi:selenocysteine lyase/cysteine desulfurase
MTQTEFPALRRLGYAYLDNAATTQKPDCVLEEMRRIYETCNANVHRSPPCHRAADDGGV